MGRPKKKEKDTTRRRATDLPTDLDAWVQEEMDKRGGMSFSLYCRLVLQTIRARAERGDHILPEPK